ncbi:unnamed protein product [Lampetra planeri]
MEPQVVLSWFSHTERKSSAWLGEAVQRGAPLGTKPILVRLLVVLMLMVLVEVVSDPGVVQPIALVRPRRSAARSLCVCLPKKSSHVTSAFKFSAVGSYYRTVTGYTSSASPRLQQSANRGHRELRSGVRRRRRGPPDPSVEASRDRNQDEVLQPRFDVERPGAERGRSSPRGARRRETGGAADGPRASHSSALTPVNTTGSQQRLFAQRRGQHSGGGGTQAACCAPPAHAAQGPSVWAARGS